MERVSAKRMLSTTLPVLLKYLLCNFHDFELGVIKVIQGQGHSRSKVMVPIDSHGWFSIRVLLTQSSYLLPFLKYLTCNFNGLELGQFKVI